MPDPFITLGDIPLLGTSPDGQEAPPSRLKDVKAAREIHSILVEGDRKSSLNRARVQAMVDGQPPYDPVVLRNAGSADRTNINFGHSEMMLENAMAAYVDLTSSVEHLVRLRTTVGEASEQEEWSRVISEEVSNTLKAWPAYQYEHLNLCHHFVLHGVGVVFWEDTNDWRWVSTGLGDVRIPRQTPASEDQIEVLEAERKVSIGQLWRTVGDEAMAAARGWNVEECRKAMTRAASAANSAWSTWERLQAELKNNDLCAAAQAAQMEFIHMWVPEFDKTVSHYIFTADGQGEDFLYRGIGDYESVQRAFVFFPYGLGTNGTYHGIRGMGFKIYAHAQLANRMWSHAADAAALGSAAMVQPTDLRAVENFTLISQGPFAFLPPNMQFVERAVPDLSKSVMPVLQGIDRLMQDRAGHYSTASVFAGGREKTRFEVAAHLDEASKLSTTNLNFYYAPADRVIQETVRRMTRPGYSEQEPGGDLVADLYRRCAARGVPPEAVQAVDYSRATMVRAVGSGSQAKRLVSLQQLNEIASAFDDQGRYELARDQAAALVGYDQVNRYMPRREETRVHPEAKVAFLENGHLEGGQQVPVFANERHLVHLGIHVPKLEEMRGMYESGEALLEDLIGRMIPLFEHSVAHVEQLQTEVVAQGEVSQYNQRLQFISELIINGQKLLQAKEREAFKAASREGGEAAMAPEGEEGAAPQPGQDRQYSDMLDEKLRERVMMHRLSLQHMDEKHRLKLEQQRIEFEQKRQIKDMEKALELRTLLK